MPVIEWKKYQVEPFTDLSAFKPDSNVAVICGQASMNHLVLDFETRQAFEAFFPSKAEQDKILSETWIVESGGGRGGIHIHLRNDAPVKALAIHEKGIMELDVQGEGRIAILPPSKTKSEYWFINKPPEIKSVHNFEKFIIERLADLGVQKSSDKRIRDYGKGSNQGNRHNDALKMALFYIHTLKLEPDSALAGLKRWGELCDPPYTDMKDLQSVLDSAISYLPPKKLAREEKVKLIPSPGRWDDGYAFEQILTPEGYRYAVHEDGEIKVVEQVDVYSPVKRLYWRTAPGVPTKCTKAEVWKDILDYLYVHIDFDDVRSYTILASFVLATWTLEMWNAVGYLGIVAVKSSGKTRVLECIEMLGFRGLISPSFSEATTYHIMDECHPILLFDEAAKFGKDEGRIMDIIKGGQRRGQYVYIMQEDSETGKMVPTPFDPFGFKVFASVLPLSDQLTSRCIPVGISKNTRFVPPFVNDEWAREIRSKLLYLKFTNGIANGDTVTYPDLLNGRVVELYAPLVNVVPTEKLPLIMDSAIRTQEIRTLEDADTFEGDVLACIIELRKEGKFFEGDTYLTSDVCDKMNGRRNLDPQAKDALNVRSIGHRLSGLQFQEHSRINNKAARTLPNYTLLKQLRRYYPADPLVTELEGGLPKNGYIGLIDQLVSNPSVSSNPSEGGSGAVELDKLSPEQQKRVQGIKMRRKDELMKWRKPQLMTASALGLPRRGKRRRQEGGSRKGRRK